MQMSEINSLNAMAHCNAVEKPTDEELQNEYDFYVASIIVEKMLEQGLISEHESARLSAENTKYFSPILARIS